MSHDEQQHSRVLVSHVVVAGIFLLRSQRSNGGTEKVRLVLKKGEAVEGEPRTTRQAAEKGELSVDRGAGGKSEEE